MTDINTLKVLAGQKITELTDKSSSAKKHMLRYIREADEYEVKNFLLDQEIRPIQEDEKEIIDNRFQKSEILNEASPFELFMREVGKAKELAKSLNDSIKGFMGNKGANIASGFSDKMTKPLQKASGSPLNQLKEKSTGLIDTIAKKLNAGNVSDVFKQSLEYLHTSVHQNPVAMGSGILLAMIAALAFGIKSKKSDEKKASGEVYASLKKNDKLDKDKQKAAEAIAKAYKS